MTLSLQHQIQLEERGLDLETCLALGFETRADSPQWLSIPYVQQGRVVNHKYRKGLPLGAANKAFSQDKGGKKCLWNFDVLLDQSLAGEPVIMTEGELDAVAAIQSGWPRTVSVPEGAPAQALGLEGGEQKYSFLDDAIPLLSDCKKIILAFDGDDAGGNLVQDISVRLGRWRCQYVPWPKFDKGAAQHFKRERAKDLNEVLLASGAGGVNMALKGAQWIKVDGLFKMSELPPLPALPAYNIGISYLWKHYRIRPGDFAVLTGIPSHGKTTLANEIACRMALPTKGSEEAERVKGLLPFVIGTLDTPDVPEDLGHGWHVALASFEQRPQTDLRFALRRLRGGVHPDNLSPDARRAIDDWIDEHFTLIVPNEDADVTLEWTLERFAVAFTQTGARLGVLDPWNEMDHFRPPGMSLTDYTGAAIKSFKRLAWRQRAHMLVLAHPTKQEKKSDGSIPCPSLYDISDSAHWANKADVGIVVHREPTNRTMIKIPKTRYEDIGEPGSIFGKLNRATGRFVIEEPLT